jgi:hypothetical protein
MPVYSQNDLDFDFVKQVQARHEGKLFRLPGVIGGCTVGSIPLISRAK